MTFERTEDRVLEGVLLPRSWGASGEIVDICLMAFDEDEYRIDSAVATTHGFRDLLRKHVRLSGTVRDGRVIRVRQIEIIMGKHLRPGVGASDEHVENGGKV